MPKVELTHLDVNTCRLCLEEHDCYKDLFHEYSWMGQKEIYNEILLEIFGITPHTDSISKVKAICNTCIMKLREALEFKKQIWDCEKRLYDYFSTLKGSIDDESTLWKIEGLKEEFLDDNLDDYDQSEDEKVEIQSTTEEEGEEVEIEEILKNIRKIKKLSKNVKTNKKVTRALNIPIRRNEDTRTSSKQQIPKKILIAKDLVATKPKGFKIRLKRENTPVYNALMLLQHSNMTPFIWEARKRFACFCCSDYFDNFTKLKEHTKNNHDLDHMQAKMRKWHKSKWYKVDVSSLQCTTCNEDCKDIESLKNHLVETHGIAFKNLEEDILIPFLLDKNLFRCYFCHEIYQSFHSLNVHMNCHFLNHICEVCGISFKNNINLEKHMSRHTGCVEKCVHCDIVFKSLYKKRQHDVEVHKKTPIHRCPECPERFFEFRHKMKHQLEVHKSALPEYKCDQCDKKFLRKYLLSQHVRKEHLLECNFKCDECDKTFFEKKELKHHMINHFGERIHKCTFCNKSYPRKGTLREHLKIHLNIRKWVCRVCGEAFVQNISLKKHMKKHDM